MPGKTKPIISAWLAAMLLHLPSAARAESTAVLPKGVRTLLYRHIQAEVPGLYGVDSNFQTFRIEEKLDANRIASAYKPAQELLKEIAAVDSEAARAIDFGSVDLNPNVRVQVDAFAFGWGLGQDTMVVAVAPFWRARVDMSKSTFTSSQSLKATAERLEKIAAKTQDPERTKILSQILSRLPTVSGGNLQDVLVSRYGYKPIGSWSGEGFGDTSLFVHRRFLATSNTRLGARLGLMLPTGRKDDPDNLVDVPFGEGVFGTYAESLADLHPLPGAYFDWLVLNAGARYQYNWESTRTFRLIEDASFPLASEKESIRYKPGDRWSARAGADMKIATPLRAYSTYSFERIERDRIQGAKTGYDYNLLMNDTDAEIHTVETGVRFSTVNWYKSGEFAVPLEMTASYSRVVRGKNTELVSLGFAELSLYF